MLLTRVDLGVRTVRIPCHLQLSVCVCVSLTLVISFAELLPPSVLIEGQYVLSQFTAYQCFLLHSFTHLLSIFFHLSLAPFPGVQIFIFYTQFT